MGASHLVSPGSLEPLPGHYDSATQVNLEPLCKIPRILMWAFLSVGGLLRVQAVLSVLTVTRAVYMPGWGCVRGHNLKISSSWGVLWTLERPGSRESTRAHVMDHTLLSVKWGSEGSPRTLVPPLWALLQCWCISWELHGKDTDSTLSSGIVTALF